jgi:hypothetical protein
MGAADAEEIRSTGLVRDFVQDRTWGRYRYQIDIDGNANAFIGCFVRLLTGSPILKVASRDGFRQWYYDRLVPWRNYVPVAADMSDLVDKVRWLLANDDKARDIGDAGRALAVSMDYQTEMRAAVQTIAAAIRQGKCQMSIAKELSQHIHGGDVYAGFVPTFAEDLLGWNSRHPVFGELIAECKAKIVIDVGVWKGGSTVFLAELLKERGGPGVVLAVDTFLGSPEHWDRQGNMCDLIPRRHGMPMLYEQFMSNIVRRGLQDWVVPVPQTSISAAIVLWRAGVRADFVHIDAAHDYEAVLADVRAYWGLLNPGGYLVGDDYHSSWPGVIKAADQFAAEVGAELRIAAPKWVVRKP